MNTQSKNWSFTWNQTVTAKRLPNKKILLRFLNSISERAWFQLEAGGEKGKAHYQGWFRLDSSRLSKTKVIDIFKSRFKDVSGLTVRKTFDSLASMRYSTKEKGRLDGPWFCGSQEAYNEKLSEMKLDLWQEQLYNLLLKLHNMNTLKLPEDQMQVLRHILKRGVIYIEDSLGGGGKTSFSRFLRQGQRRFEARKLPIGSVERCISAAVKLSKENPPPSVFMVDMPRVVGESLSVKDLFHQLEEVKGGYLVGSYYGSYSEGFFDDPIIIVFSNHPLSSVYDLMSRDRWYHYKIEDRGEDLGLVCYGLGYYNSTNRKGIQLVEGDEKNNV